MSGTTNETASCGSTTGDQGSVRAAVSNRRRFDEIGCATCGSRWWAQCGDSNVFRCIECKALYTGPMLAAEEVLKALKTMLDNACAAADINDDGTLTVPVTQSEWDNHVAACATARAVIAKAEGKP